jgi:hypothetical protein
MIEISILCLRVEDLRVFGIWDMGFLGFSNLGFGVWIFGLKLWG